MNCIQTVLSTKIDSYLERECSLQTMARYISNKLLYGIGTHIITGADSGGGGEGVDGVASHPLSLVLLCTIL